MILRRFGNYAKAVTRHVASGMERRTDQEVDSVFSICKSCESYRGGVCKRCGCRCNTGKIALLNKLRMKSEHCPDGKW